MRVFIEACILCVHRGKRTDGSQWHWHQTGIGLGLGHSEACVEARSARRADHPNLPLPRVLCSSACERLSCRREMRVPVRARKPIWMAVECWSAHIELLPGSGEEQIDDQDLSDASLRAV